MDAREPLHSLSVGHEKIDADHNRMLEAIDRLMRVAGGGNKAACEREFDNLIALTWEHFAFEEKLMVQHRYPDIDCHQKEHAKLVDELILLKAYCDDGSMSIPDNMRDALHRWMTKHIQECDKPLANYILLTDGGVRTTPGFVSSRG